MEFFTPREGSTDAFDQTSFDADGTVEHAVGSFDAHGRYLNDAGDARVILTFDAPDAMRAVWETRQPDDGWAEWMHVTFTRVADPHIEVRSKDDHTT
ncbi:hypothetical protein F6B41_01995 [Microbacterium lushaniae]|nr:hypothetical protein F6B41_08155 [Microbacterium lushaniae]KAA9159240.1 hypothetical protein F6B41_01995 [Microbacterium lushaniae]